MKKILLILFVSMSLISFGQTFPITGTVIDKSTGETLPGANVVFANNPSVGVATDFDGKFTLKVKPGTYQLSVSYVGYKKVTQKIVVQNATVNVVFKLSSKMLQEVDVVSDIAIDRKTPVAHISIKAADIQEKLAGQDLPMILNSTPGAYSTQGGGGDGDADIRIRGFKGNFVGVLLDGIPVNDMENGWVYWSNWFGLSSILRSMDIQRGLGASKLAIPSIGGTINILTKGIENKRQINVDQSVDMYGKNTTTVGYNSGAFANGWSVTLAASQKNGSGWVDHTDVSAYFYFVKINKRIKNHLFSFTTFGAPQEHTQRSYKSRIATYDMDYAKSVGIDIDNQDNLPYGLNSDFDTVALVDKGFGYNPNWGFLKRDRYDSLVSKKAVNMKVNQYFKPMFYLKDFWNINEKVSMSNILYMSLGNGGGVSGIAEQDGTSGPSNKYTDDGQVDLQWFYSQNVRVTPGSFGDISPVDINYDANLYKSKYVIPQNVNEHMWVGYLNTINVNLTPELSQNIGVDLRHYKGTHYESVYDLLGGDYYVRPSDSTMIYKGDKFRYYNDTWVTWGGAFYQAIYSTPIYTALINVTGNVSSFEQSDYLNNTKSGRKTLFGWTAKAGFNYNITETLNAFVNAGYYDKVQGSKYIYQGYSTNFSNIGNEKIKSAEIGVMYKSKFLSGRINGYVTQWDNRPSVLKSKDDNDDPVSAAIGLKSKHMGIEFDGTYKPLRNLEFRTWLSFGDWKWDSKLDNVALYDDKGDVKKHTSFNIKGIHISDAAQSQIGGSIKYRPIKGAYISLSSTYFDKYYSDFSLNSANLSSFEAIDSWEIPARYTIDLHAGYGFSFAPIKKYKFKLSLSVLNITDEKYISSATNNDNYSTGSLTFQDYDAKSAVVFFGAPRTILFKLGVRF